MSPETLLGMIDTAIAEADTCRYDLTAGGYPGPGSTPGVESMRWVPDLSTAVSLGWVYPPYVRYVPAETERGDCADLDHQPAHRPWHHLEPDPECPSCRAQFGWPDTPNLSVEPRPERPTPSPTVASHRRVSRWKALKAVVLRRAGEVPPL